MGFLKKAAGLAFNPINAAILQGKNTLFGNPGTTGPGLPPPDLSFLKDNADLRKILSTQDNKAFSTDPYNFLLHSPGLDQAQGQAMGLPGQATSFADRYSAPTPTNDAAFQDYIDSIGGPSSTLDVQNQIDDETMQQLLAGIDTDTRQAMGGLRSDYADRGLSGPGMSSDIEAAALGEAAGAGAKNKGLIRSDFATKRAERIANDERARQEARTGAYGTRYGAGTEADTQARSIAAQGAMTDASMYNQLLGQGAGLNADLSKAELGDQSTREALFAQLLSGNSEALRGREDLLAQLINQRDLARATGQVSAYGNSNTTSGQKAGIFAPIQLGANFGFKG